MNIWSILLCFFHIHRLQYKPRSGICLHLRTKVITHLRRENHSQTELSRFSEE